MINIHIYIYILLSQYSVSLTLLFFIYVLFTVPSTQGVQSDNDPNNTTVRSLFYFSFVMAIFVATLLIPIFVAECRFLLVALSPMLLRTC
jgi:hypothetical protein